MEDLKKTPLNEKHRSLGAKMVPFGGWDMPVQYPEGIIAEHRHTRTSVSIFDTCHMGEFKLTGTNIAEKLDKIFPRAVADQKIGTARYNFLLSNEGTVMDDLLIYRMGEEEFFIVVNAGTIESDAQRIINLLPKDIKFENLSAKTGKIDIQGPLTLSVMEKIGFKKEELPKVYKWIKTSVNGMPALLSRTGYTGELGFEFYVDADKVGKLWDYLLSFEGVKPAGLGARDTLRLEVGYPLYGNEMDTKTTPIEAGFSEIIGIEKRSNFLAEKILKDPKSKKKTLTAVVLQGRRAARHGEKVFSTEGKEIGVVTSGMFAPMVEKAIALAYINSSESLKIGDKILLQSGRAQIEGEIVEIPFYKNGTVRMKL